MSWIKDANKKYKRYRESLLGFRIYTIRPSSRMEYIEEREDGRYRVTEFVKGEFVAVNKDGITFRRPHTTELWEDILLYTNTGVIMPSQEQYNKMKTD